MVVLLLEQQRKLPKTPEHSTVHAKDYLRHQMQIKENFSTLKKRSGAGRMQHMHRLSIQTCE